ncbi:hypothetical protein C9374_011439 [Naegleria lovaniensis]|uniref:F-box domain-containing protein n=1 Tax=Naegleria lovaniensis TaxID=51637 RepID=A0AA88GY50_NAELO|nr:uncharacterized protein C9374_011439 [Naegleria lovaniensis]KAG2392714.1 hypothetical protein C9374_011439 [Naegleria lovaniensis]
MSSSLTTLPFEVVVAIFSFIPQSDRKKWIFRTARLVCSEWNNCILSSLNILIQVPPRQSIKKSNGNRYQPILNGFRERDYFQNISSLKFGKFFDVSLLYKCTVTTIQKSSQYENTMSCINPFEKFSNLHNLCLHDAGLSGHELIMICKHSENLRTLKSLTLSRNKLTFKEVQLIVGCQYFNLTSLNLSDNDINNDGCVEIVCGKSMEKLTHLDLSKNPINDINIFAHNLKQLRHLNVSDCPLEKDAHVFATSENLKNLKEFLSKRHRMDKGCIDIASSPVIEFVSLSFEDCFNLGCDHVLKLACNERMKNLTSLNLAQNEIGDTGLVALAQSEFMSNLKFLNLNTNVVTFEGIQALATSRFMSNLEYLHLGNDSHLDSIREYSYNKVSKESLLVLVNSPYMSQLRTLILCRNTINDHQCEIIASGKYMKNLTYLDISDDKSRYYKGLKKRSYKRLMNSTVFKLKHLEMTFQDP